MRDAGLFLILAILGFLAGVLLGALFSVRIFGDPK